MIIIDSKSEMVFLFDEGILRIFNSKVNFKRERLPLAILFIVLSLLGLISQNSNYEIFFTLLWTLLISFWIIYILVHSCDSKIPQSISYTQIEKIYHSNRSKYQILKIYYRDNNKPKIIEITYLNNLVDFSDFMSKYGMQLIEE